jgi:hypothetical protein
MRQEVARSLVQKAGQGDIVAIKEVLDRIDGKTLPGAPESDDGPTKLKCLMGTVEVIDVSRDALKIINRGPKEPPASSV